MLKPRYLLSVLLGVSVLCASFTQAREIALSFDDVPTPDSVLFTGEARTAKIIQALDDNEVKNALFFVKANNITPQTAKRLKQYTDKGFHLAHHSYAHPSAEKISVADYLADFDKAHAILRKFDNVQPLHRFPFLHYGADLDAINLLQRKITARGYQDGYVTVDNFDWYISALITEAAENGQTIHWDKARDFYLETLYAGIEFYDAIAQRQLGRSPRHVLLLHENDAAALFLGDLIRHLRSKGWKIISPARAYQDAIADEFPATDFHKQGRIAAIAKAQGVDPALLRHASENEAYLKAAFIAAGIIDVPQSQRAGQN